jgi:hypothetical protein
MQSLLATKTDLIALLNDLLGEWQLPNVTGTVPAIAITPDPITGEVYPPPGTELTHGIEVIVRVKGVSCPVLDGALEVAIEAVLACPLSASSALSAAIKVASDSGKYLVTGLTPSNNGQSQVFKLIRFFYEV